MYTNIDYDRTVIVKILSNYTGEQKFETQEFIFRSL